MRKHRRDNPAPGRSIPILSPMEERVLDQVVRWADEHAAAEAANEHLAYLKTPTTKMCSEYFRYGHGEMLDLLNRLEKQELIVKERRQSAGTTGNGFDGSLHSAVVPTHWGRVVAARKA